MKERTYRLLHFSFYDQTAITRHLEQMAKKGWLLEKTGSALWRYRAIAPQDLRFAVTYFPEASEFDPGPTEGQQVLADFAARDGWQYLTQWGQMQIFFTEREDAPPMETEPAIQVETIFRAMKKNLIPSHLVMLLLCLYQLGFDLVRFRQDTVDFLSTPYLLLSLPLWAMLLLEECWEIFCCLRWYRRAKPMAEDGVFLPVRTSQTLSILLLVSALLVIFSISLLSSTGRWAMVMWLGLMVLAIVASGWVKDKLKAIGASRAFTRTATILTATVVTVVFVFGLTFGIIRGGFLGRKDAVGSYDMGGWTFEIYDDPMPLYVEDLTDTGDSLWSREQVRSNSTFLLSRREYRQDLVEGPKELRDLAYTIVDIRFPALEDTVRRSLLAERQDEIHGDYVFIDHYEPVDPAPWGAEEAWQLHWSDGVLNTWLVFWKGRAVEVKFYWPPTAEQIAIAAEKLRPTE